jgi:hypothetical protein
MIDPATITYLAVSDSTGAVPSQFYINHPITVTIGLVPKDAAADHPVYFGLVEKDGAQPAGQLTSTCLLGSFQASYVRGTDPNQPTLFKQQVVVPEECLGTGKTSRTYRLWVALDPVMTSNDDLDDVSPDDFNTQFFNEAQEDSDMKGRNALCKTDKGTPGCVLDVVVAPSPGHNLVLSALETRSSVAVLPPDCAVDYASPPIAVKSDVTIYGSTAYPEDTSTSTRANNLSSAGGAGAVANVRYSICPAGPKQAGTDDSALPGCASGTSYVDLKLLGPRAAKGALVDSATLESLTTDNHASLNHQLYLPPGSEACRRVTGGVGGFGELEQVRHLHSSLVRRRGVYGGGAYGCTDGQLQVDSHQDGAFDPRSQRGLELLVCQELVPARRKRGHWPLGVV